MNILIAGASSSIAQALIRVLTNFGHSVYSISRSTNIHQSLVPNQHLTIDLSQATCLPTLRTFVQKTQPDVVFCCTGLLHNAEHMPEKSLSQINADWLHQSIDANILPHIHLAQAIAPLLTPRHSIKWISLSAMVGSIEDNHLGGWYSYRMSKAALNMFIKNLSIEWVRKSPHTIVVAQHPGTTESHLSKPFQANISADHLFSAELTAKRLIEVMQHLNPQQHGKLLHWDGAILSY
jgi:NAD(P)-dependent dehydrogenase (short-subunit alcohol dehydrogenase family)